MYKGMANTCPFRPMMDGQAGQHFRPAREGYLTFIPFQPR